MASAMVVAMARLATAAPLLSPVVQSSARPAALAHVRGTRRLALDRQALAVLRAQPSMLVDAFPLTATRTVELVVTRFDPFAPHVRIEKVAADGVHRIAAPDQAYFAGEVRGEPDSRVVLIAGPNAVSGFVASQGGVFPFGPDASGGHVIYALEDADPTAYPPPGDFCANDLHPALVDPVGAARALQHTAAATTAPATTAGLTLRVADIAIETDQELRSKFPSDQATLNYLASLLAAATAIYERDVSVRLQFSYIRLWDGTPADPWTATSTSAALTEIGNYWNNPANSMGTIAGPRDLVHFISGKTVQGGIAYLSALCSNSIGYGVSQVFGSFNLANPQQIWDVVVFTHELGHNFGSPHSHCYNPPLDHCYNGESGCYAGPEEVSHGTLMSYCHLLSGGLANIDLLFGSTISAQIASHVAAASCLGSVNVTTSTTPASTTTSVTATTSTTIFGATTTTSTSSTSTTDPAHPSTTTTTGPRGPADGDGDGITDPFDLCAGTPPADLVDATGCSVCPCDGPSGSAWPSRGRFLRCVRVEARRRFAAGELDAMGRKAALKRARTSTCARANRTRCCLYVGDADRVGTCQLLPPATCATRALPDDAIDLGAGSCLPAPCAR